jgi:hypothetical protein
MEAKEADMGCWHGYHGCGPWHGGPYSPGWYDADTWDEADVRPVRRGRPGRPVDRGPGTEELAARLEELLGEVRRVESELADLRASTATGGVKA